MFLKSYKGPEISFYYDANSTISSNPRDATSKSGGKRRLRNEDDERSLVMIENTLYVLFD